MKKYYRLVDGRDFDLTQVIKPGSGLVWDDNFYKQWALNW